MVHYLAFVRGCRANFSWRRQRLLSSFVYRANNVQPCVRKKDRSPKVDTQACPLLCIHDFSLLCAVFAIFLRIRSLRPTGRPNLHTAQRNPEATSSMVLSTLCGRVVPELGAHQKNHLCGQLRWCRLSANATTTMRLGWFLSLVCGAVEDFCETSLSCAPTIRISTL